MVPARRSEEPTARRRARRILLTLYAAATLSVLAVMFSVARGNSETGGSGTDPQGRDLAYVAAVNYLSGKDLNLPHAKSFDPKDLSLGTQARTAMPYRALSWVGFDNQNFGSDDLGYTTFEVHHFLVVPEAGQAQPTPAPSRQAGSGAPAAPRTPGPSASAPAPSGSAAANPSGSATPGAPTPSPTGVDMLQLDVSILITQQGPRLAAAPAFSAWTGGSSAAEGTADYSNFSGLGADVGDGVKNQIGLWAKAYASGDAATLLALTGDQNAEHRYQGLSGFGLAADSSAVQVMSAIKSASGQIVRVRLLLTRPGSPQAFTTYADFDLLVGSPEGAQPPILAWGPAGSAASLEPYSNALTS